MARVRIVAMTLFAVVTMTASTVAPVAAAPSDDGPTERCADLLKGNSDRAGEVEVVDASPDLPEYCRVVGTVSKTINYEVRLPTTAWNGKFYMTGCGGFCGNVNADACNAALARGYAIAATDGGHSGSSLDGTWGLDDRRAEIDWASRAVHLVAGNTKRLIRSYYGEAPAYSYFSGCSGGGREALMSAQTHPDDFDGIIAGAPANYQAYLAGVSQTWIEQAQFDDAGNRIFGVEKLGLIGAAVYDQCDGLDGLVDGQIDDPRNCDVISVVASLACPPRPDGSDCLTAVEAEAVAKIYDSPRNRAGEALYPGGLPAGSEELWFFLSVGFGDDLSIGGSFAQEYHRYLAYTRDPGEIFSLFDFDFDTDVKRLNPMARIFNATSPNLGGFKANGGKLLLYHGYADPLITPYGTVAYYESVVDKMGGPEATAEFARLFLLPGMGHCGGGPGPSVVDYLTAMENWVENGVEPDELIASRPAGDGTVDRNRPVYPYPQVARYNGAGSIDDASNFGPVVP
ncbi:MAG: tannase/feruloyl esterase family alpha/beta hydrolase [Acidimicrobiia bacterium]|nr:tannase/feruloyl esterase family alpha/beta hydrolase [Acidimicrobiia bacterium]